MCSTWPAFCDAKLPVYDPPTSLSGVIKGQATDLEIQAREMLKTRNALIEIYVKATGKDFETIEKAIDRDTWMTAPEARDFGLLDDVVESFEKLQMS